MVHSSGNGVKLARSVSARSTWCLCQNSMPSACERTQQASNQFKGLDSTTTAQRSGLLRPCCVSRYQLCREWFILPAPCCSRADPWLWWCTRQLQKERNQPDMKQDALNIRMKLVDSRVFSTNWLTLRHEDSYTLFASVISGCGAQTSMASARMSTFTSPTRKTQQCGLVHTQLSDRDVTNLTIRSIAKLCCTTITRQKLEACTWIKLRDSCLIVIANSHSTV